MQVILDKPRTDIRAGDIRQTSDRYQSRYPQGGGEYLDCGHGRSVQ